MKKTSTNQPFMIEDFVGTRSVGFPERKLNLGFVQLGSDSRPKTNKRYPIVSASDSSLEDLEVPSTPYKRLDMDLYEFWIDDLPDFWSNKNEGLLKVSINTLNPQDLQAIDEEAVIATNFQGKDKSYAPSFFYRGMYRNVLLENWINLKIDLYELDKDAGEYFNKVKEVVNGVPEVKNLDIIKGIPYLNLASSLFNSIITTFGKNSDDYVWGEMPILEIEPTLGGAFLRSGIYVLYEELNSRNERISHTNMAYLNGKVKAVKKNNVLNKALSNHLIFGLRLKPFVQKPIA